MGSHAPGAEWNQLCRRMGLVEETDGLPSAAKSVRTAPLRLPRLTRRRILLDLVANLAVVARRIVV